MEDAGVERLREHLRRHNRRVLGLTVLTLMVVMGLWAALYFVAWWMFVLGGTVARAGDFHPMAGPMARGFVGAGVLACLLAWVLGRLRPEAGARDRKSAWEHLLDVALAVPRLTLAVLGTGLAAARLREDELERAWEVLRRMHEAETPVRVSELPVEIPDAGMRERIVTALQVSDVIEIRPGPEGAVLAFRDKEARRLGETRVRLRG